MFFCLSQNTEYGCRREVTEEKKKGSLVAPRERREAVILSVVRILDSTISMKWSACHRLRQPDFLKVLY